MGNMVTAVAEDKWVLATGENAVRGAEIEAWIAARGEVMDLYAFWCNHLGFAPAGAPEMKARLDELYALLVKVPWCNLTRIKDGPDGELCYINRDYYEDGGGEVNEVHRTKVEENVGEVYAAMGAIEKEVQTWDLDERVKTRYEAVRQKAFVSVRKCLKIPDLRGVRRREETGALRPAWQKAEMGDLLRALEGCAE